MSDTGNQPPASDPVTDPPASDPSNPDPSTPPESNAPDAAALAAEVERWKKEARKHEDRWKANKTAADELAALKATTMSDTEKAIQAARDETRAAVMAEVGGELVEEALRTALTARQINAEPLLAVLDRKQFLGDDGKPDRSKINEWIDSFAPKGDDPTPPPPPAIPPAKDIGQGPRNGGTPAQIRDRNALKDMTSEEIDQAHREGRLDFLLNGGS
jgi:hypothetical protein